ncbi:hypothetical protein I3271_03410 [Photobacterium leiognathi]|uniref:hypothetical protein n=1 Tax=Photobacterium leiognathi TaxID=553611 RepID=UPI001EE0E71A|nr:hypothetical protein [Photobacterium leiognathi]MCG3883729.1 hypothetical protein [Photobacterium leiognathi]
MIKINKIAALLVLTLCSTSSVGAQNLDGDLFELFPEYIKSVSPSKLWASYVLDSLQNEKEDILRFIDILKGDAYPPSKQEELLLNMLVTHIKARNSGVDEYLLNELSSIDNEYSKVASLKLKDITDFANDFRKKIKVSRSLGCRSYEGTRCLCGVSP